MAETFRHLLMAHKTGVILGLNTGDATGHLLMTLGTIVHLHPIPGVFLEPGDAFPPNISTISGDSIFFVNP